MYIKLKDEEVKEAVELWIAIKMPTTGPFEVMLNSGVGSYTTVETDPAMFLYPKENNV